MSSEWWSPGTRRCIFGVSVSRLLHLSLRAEAQGQETVCLLLLSIFVVSETIREFRFEDARTNRAFDDVAWIVSIDTLSSTYRQAPIHSHSLETCWIQWQWLEKEGKASFIEWWGTNMRVPSPFFFRTFHLASNPYLQPLLYTNAAHRDSKLITSFILFSCL